MSELLKLRRAAVSRIVLAGTLALSLGLGGTVQGQVAAPVRTEAPAPRKAETGGDLIGYRSIHHPEVARDGMVVSQSKLASRIGADILAKGGSAVDAAVAVGIVETLTLPRAGNIGGGGYMLIHDAKSGKTVAIEYYGQAPQAVTPDYLLNAQGKIDMGKSMSYKGVTIPGTIAGLYEAHQRFGRMPWADLVQPAIDLADKGMVMTNDEAGALEQRRDAMAKDPGGALKVYFKPDGSAYKPGEVFRNPDLVWTLRQIQARGADGFYKGPVAERLVAGVKAGGGIITLGDLASYKANVLEPIWSDYRGFRIAHMPPTATGFNVAEALNILEHFPMAELGQGNVASMHLIAEALKIASADRQYSGEGLQWQDPPKVIASNEFAAERAKLISMEKTLDSASLPRLVTHPEGPDTTHFSVADKYGNVVSNTYTLSASYGAHVVAPGTGFLLNNSLANFDWEPGAKGVGNPIGPGRRAHSTISPVIVFKDEKPWIATGTPGGGTIVSTMVQVLVNLLDYRLNIAEAVQRPRFYQDDVDGPMQLEESIPQDLFAGLQAKGHKVERSQIIGSTQSIMIGSDGLFYGAADTRRPGAGVVGVTQY